MRLRRTEQRHQPTSLSFEGQVPGPHQHSGALGHFQAGGTHYGVVCGLPRPRPWKPRSAEPSSRVVTRSDPQPALIANLHRRKQAGRGFPDHSGNQRPWGDEAVLKLCSPAANDIAPR